MARCGVADMPVGRTATPGRRRSTGSRPTGWASAARPVVTSRPGTPAGARTAALGLGHLPVHNQAAHIGDRGGAIATRSDSIGPPYEIVLVLNGCRDESEAVCQHAGETLPEITVIDDPRAGWGLAVKAGLRAARGDLLCYTNSARTSAADLHLLIG